ncbi:MULTISPECIES: LysR family transcriptional regulator [Caballeronia]|jgi:DNA-binding transcriptional LysR family regulator|uniref:LysR family transcriptional regulator n=2 Tax=Burkholderiaceae TaxID=119060 RepID=UPI00074C5DA2|nr:MULTISPECIES: LysR family transcriptional regulator [Caballeronia]MCG7403804.1 LysR family transcriptional regulator [Caballeronia zhejiangensis]MCI1044732.1 LysR family transcriptional regulator [Caballeronia zhejiangensis]MDR5795240.1 LysR family transcriptional regulator [Caballeronia sp. LZ008]SAL42540.1 LysR family transcriptional regulator [Caballeronia turbans]
MKTSGLTELEAVLSVARHRSFRAAANELSVSTSALSHAIAALEARIGVRLFNRTTRSVSLSEAGAQFVQNIAPALSTIRDALEQAGSFRDTPSGTLRINTSVGAAHQAMPLFIAFLKRYPDMKLDIVTEGRLIDIVVEGFDAGIRLLETVPQDMIAVPFGDRQRFAVVGSPAYFEQHKPPRTPADLATHRCIRSRMPSGSIYQWEFERHGESIRIDGDGALTLDEPGMMLTAARAGIGLAYLTEWNVAADLEAGALVRVLEDWTPPLDGLCLYYPGRRHVPAGLRALTDMIREYADANRKHPAPKKKRRKVNSKT